MKPEKMLEIIDAYEAQLAPIVRDDPHMDHIIKMLPRMRNLIPDRMERANRWLGFIQGVLWQVGLRTIPELVADNGDDMIEEDAKTKASTAGADSGIWGGP